MALPKTSLITDSFETVLKAKPDMTALQAYHAGAALAATTIYKAITLDKDLLLPAIAALLQEADTTLTLLEEKHATH
jgi:hypothetical protein